MKKPSVLVPGVVLRESLDAYHLTPAKLAEDIQLSQSAVRQILSNKTKISLNVGLRLSKYFGNPAPYWVQLQNEYDLVESSRNEELSAILKSIPKVQKPSASKKDMPPKSPDTGQESCSKECSCEKACR
jgi:addiction module HigA family antidote